MNIISDVALFRALKNKEKITEVPICYATETSNVAASIGGIQSQNVQMFDIMTSRDVAFKNAFRGTLSSKAGSHVSWKGALHLQIGEKGCIWPLNHPVPISMMTSSMQEVSNVIVVCSFPTS